MAERLDAADWDTIEASRGVRRRARSARCIDVAIGGLAAQPAVASVIAGATRPSRCATTCGPGSWQPTVEDLAELDEITIPASSAPAPARQLTR